VLESACARSREPAGAIRSIHERVGFGYQAEVTKVSREKWRLV